ncbi:RING-H2 finger protein ATL18 [Senna tora]|uniref:RING-H2 finger protein ATL18 n=1 Tax=Senna tora TaxID=362788 RepID=A0A834SZ26_9FABA|nr:RING-H2 finger protein ATL18 [Senna tora]
MNCFMVCESRWWMVTIVLYTCIWIPLVGLKRALIALFSFKGTSSTHMEWPEFPLLPVARYEDLKTTTTTTHKSSSSISETTIIEEDCSICLLEFEGGEEIVCKLDRCGHVFHMNCIEGWLHRNHFTCPLWGCRRITISNIDFKKWEDSPLFATDGMKPSPSTALIQMMIQTLCFNEDFKAPFSNLPLGHDAKVSELLMHVGLDYERSLEELWACVEKDLEGKHTS